MNWLDHWNLRFDPFSKQRHIYVPTPVHEDAVARLVSAIGSGRRLVSLRGGPGVGKSTVLREVSRRARSLRFKISVSSNAFDGASLFSNLAAGLGLRTSPSPAITGHAWRTLVNAVRLCSLQKLDILIVVDQCRYAELSSDLAWLTNLDPAPQVRLTIVEAAEPRDTGGEPDRVPWRLEVELRPLSRNETEFYLLQKLKVAGASEHCFTRQAVARLHLASNGIPAAIDRLAAPCLIAAANLDSATVTPSVVDETAPECFSPFLLY